MVEEIINPSNKPKVRNVIARVARASNDRILHFNVTVLQNKTARPRPVYLWNVLDVQKWLRRHCSDYYQLYHEKFLHVSTSLFS